TVIPAGCRLMAIVLRRFCSWTKCVYCMIGRTVRAVPPRPAISSPIYKLVPVFGKYGLSTVLNEKLGRSLLVMMPEREFGPEIPRKARFVNRILEASLTAITDERSYA